MNNKIKNCDMFDCIYNNDKKCLLSEVSIDTLGFCSECVRFGISYDLMEELKIETRRRLHGSQFDYIFLKQL